MMKKELVFVPSSRSQFKIDWLSIDHSDLAWLGFL